MFKRAMVLYNPATIRNMIVSERVLIVLHLVIESRIWIKMGVKGQNPGRGCAVPSFAQLPW